MSIGSLGFLGGGNMGEALLRGAVTALPGLSIGILEKNPERANYLQHTYPGIKVLGTPADLAQYDAIMIAVKPQQFVESTSGLSRLIPKGTLIISIAAGINLRKIQDIFSKCACIRVMPNTPALIGKGMAGISFGDHCSQDQQNFVVKLFSSIGEVTTIPESLINTITAVSGSGPAYFYHLIDVMANQAVGLGLSYEEAVKLLTQTMLGSAMMMQESGKTPAELIRQVTSPGGTTEAAMNKLQASDLNIIWRDTLQAAKTKAEELSLS